VTVLSLNRYGDNGAQKRILGYEDPALATSEWCALPPWSQGVVVRITPSAESGFLTGPFLRQGSWPRLCQQRLCVPLYACTEWHLLSVV